MAASPAAASPVAALVTVRDVARTFGRGETAVHALRGVSFDVLVGQLVAVRGRSGCGKTTLLNIVGGLDAPMTAVSSPSATSRSRPCSAWTSMPSPA